MFLEFDLVPTSYNQGIDNFGNPKYHLGKRGQTSNRTKPKAFQDVFVFNSIYFI